MRYHVWHNNEPEYKWCLVSGLDTHQDTVLAKRIAAGCAVECTATHCDICAEHNDSGSKYQPFDAGEYLIITYGEYDQYGINGLYKVLQQFERESMTPEQAIDNGYIEEVDYLEWSV